MNDQTVDPRDRAVGVLFFKTDDGPHGMGHRVISASYLRTAVAQELFAVHELTREQGDEVTRVLEELTQNGDVSFEDGWMSWRQGLTEVAALFEEKRREVLADEAWEGEQRAKEHARADAASDLVSQFVRYLTAAVTALPPPPVVLHAIGFETKRFQDAYWRPIETITTEERYAGGYLLHGPALMDLDFNPEGVERGYWQDDASEQELGHWTVPGWDANNDEYFTRPVEAGGITHFAPIPRGEHSAPIERKESTT